MLLQLDDITVRAHGRSLLNRLTWTMNAGEHWVVLGANGSGKTSLLNLLLGYLTPCRGSLRLGFEDPDDYETWDAARRRIGFVSSSVAQQIEPDEPAVEVVVSGRRAQINGWFQRSTEQERLDAAKILSQIGAKALTDQDWQFLSQGERQRILVGRALMVEEIALLVLDEPCAGLDPVAREHFLTFLEKLPTRRSAPSTLLVTHHVEEIAPFFTHALILRQGRALAAGPIEETLKSATLSQAFGEEVTLRRRKGMYHLSLGERGATRRKVF